MISVDVSVDIPISTIPSVAYYNGYDIWRMNPNSITSFHISTLSAHFGHAAGYRIDHLVRQIP